MKSPAVVLIPSLLDEMSEAPENNEAMAPDFEPIHPLARKLRHVLNAPENATVGDMAEIVEQLMGELKIMGSDLGGLPPPPQPMLPSVPASVAAQSEDGPLTEDEKLELGRHLLALTSLTARVAN
jgi:hypothetical protein